MSAMRNSILIILVLIPACSIGSYGTPGSNYACSIQPWAWDSDNFLEMNNIEAAIGGRGYDTDPFADLVLDLYPVPTIDEFVNILKLGPGWIGGIMHGSDWNIELACFPYSGDGKAARDVMYADALMKYGGVFKSERGGRCYSISIDAEVFGDFFSGENRTAALFVACNGMNLLPKLLPGAVSRAGYAIDDPPTLQGCIDYANVFNAMAAREDWDPDYVPLTFGDAVSNSSSDLRFVSGDEQDIQIVPWMVGHSDDLAVPDEGLEFEISIRGDVPHNPGVVTSDIFMVMGQGWEWDPLSQTHILHAAVHPIPYNDIHGIGHLYVDCDKIPSNNCSNLVLQGYNNDKMYFTLYRGCNPTSHVGGLSVTAGQARWTGTTFATDHFVLSGGDDPVAGPWHEVAEVPPQADSSCYLVDVPDPSYPYYLLSEVETNGDILTHRRARADAVARAVAKFSSQPSVAALEVTLADLAERRSVTGLRDPAGASLGDGEAAVFFTIGAYVDAVQAHVADYWHDCWGYAVHVESVDDYPVPEPDNRDAWRSHLQDRIAYYYNTHGVRYVHLIGDANDWEMWSQPWPDDWAAVKQDYDAMGFPPLGQPELDLIPCFYVVDDRPPGRNTAGWTWWIPTDTPYKDIDGDGDSDLALGRWPVHDLADVLARAATMQAYNDVGLVATEHQVEIWTGELPYRTSGDSLAVVQATALMTAEVPPAAGLDFMREAEFPDVGLRNLEAAARLNRECGVSVLGMYANASGRRYPCKQFDNTDGASPPFTVDLLAATQFNPYVMALSCGAADFQRTEDAQDLGPICEELAAAPNKGFIAMLGPMCGCWQYSNGIIGARAMRELWVGNDPVNPRSLAMSWTAAANAVREDRAGDPGTLSTLLGYAFLGDPLTPLRRPDVAVSVFDGDVPGGSQRAELFPNPSNPSVTIRFSTAAEGMVKAEIFDLRGRKVATLADGVMPRGKHVLEWDGTCDAGVGAGSGMYFCRLTADGKTQTLKLTVVK